MHPINQEIDRFQLSMMDLESMVDQNSYARLVDLFVKVLLLNNLGLHIPLMKPRIDPINTFDTSGNGVTLVNSNTVDVPHANRRKLYPYLSIHTRRQT